MGLNVPKKSPVFLADALMGFEFKSFEFSASVSLSNQQIFLKSGFWFFWFLEFGAWNLIFGTYKLFYQIVCFIQCGFQIVVFDNIIKLRRRGEFY